MYFPFSLTHFWRKRPGVSRRRFIQRFHNRVGEAAPLCLAKSS